MKVILVLLCPVVTTRLTRCVLQAALPVVGIQYNVPLLSQPQCRVCIDMPYSDGPTPTDIENCKSQGSFIAFAAKDNSNPNRLSLVAGLFSADMNQTSSHSTAAGPFNGAYWYFFPGNSVGFAGAQDIALNSADTVGTMCETRPSWHLAGNGVGNGGWRAGCATGLNDNSWRKVIYSCDVQVRHCLHVFAGVFAGVCAMCTCVST